MMPKSLSDATIAVVKATVPALEVHGLTITRRMYERLFQVDAMRDLFNQSHQGEAGSQPKALANAVMAYARNIDKLDTLGPTIERIVQKHVVLNILPEHYPFVADALLGAIRDVLGDAASNEVIAAWGEAYWFLAELLIGREAIAYRERAAQPGGWNGWRAFLVESVTVESSIIRSFTLVPTDGGKIVRHKPGQYLGFAFEVPGVGSLRRNYSISCAPNDRAYRITVKREATAGKAPGQASTWLHDQVRPGSVLQVAAPAGDFFVDPASRSPIVLLSGGVGLTPMVSMLEAIAESRSARPTWWVHGALNGQVDAMRDHVRDLASRASNVHLTTFYTQPLAGDRAGADFDVEGFISAEWLARNTPIDRATIYLCGPKPFLRTLIQGLMREGVSADRLRYEFFGPTEDLLGPEPEVNAAA
jgi:nitric oxide dioxygenase